MTSEEILDEEYEKFDTIEEKTFLDALRVVDTFFSGNARDCLDPDNCFSGSWDGTHSTARLKNNILKQVINWSKEHDCTDLIDSVIDTLENYKQFRISVKAKKFQELLESLKEEKS